MAAAGLSRPSVFFLARWLDFYSGRAYCPPMATKAQVLTPTASKLFARLPSRTVDAFRAGLLGHEVMHDTIRAAAFDLVAGQDETVDLRAFFGKVEAAIHEVAARLGLAC